MSGKDTNNEIPQMDMKIRLIHFLIMNGLGVVVLAAWVYTLHDSKAQMQMQIQENSTKYYDQNERILTVLTKISQYMEDSKYNNRVQEIRNK